MKQIKIKVSEKENIKVATLLLDALKERNLNILLLSGNLGAGKTAIAKSIVKLCGNNQNVTSPTFVLEKHYECVKHFKLIKHFDIYRLKNEEDVKNIGALEDITDKGILHIFEWPDILSKVVKEKSIFVKIAILDSKREFSIN